MRTLSGRTLFLVAVAAVILGIGYLARAVVTPLLAALLVAYILDPVVRALERMRMSRPLASGVVVVMAFALVAGAATLTATRLVSEAQAFYHDVVGEPARGTPTREAAKVALASDLPTAAPVEKVLLRTEWDGRPLWYVDEDGDGKFRPGIARVGFLRIRHDMKKYPWAGQLAERLRPTEDIGTLVAGSAGRWLTATASAGSAVADTTIGFLTLLVLFPIYLYYSLARLGWVYDVTVRHLPAAHRDRIVDILAKIHATLAAFFRGRFILLLIRWVVLLGLFLAFGVPFAGICALFAAIASLVPVIGPVVGGALPVLLLLSSAPGTARVLGLTGALIALELIEGYILLPAILGKRVGLHPLTILVATFVAGDLLGIFGMLVAIPLAAVLKILAIEFVLPEVREQAGLTPQAAPAAEPPA